jgi:SEC-C motif-containing protein
MEYSDCCGAYHLSQRTVPTAEALMRSRYTAFVMGEIAYLVATTHPSARDAGLEAAYRSTFESTQWIGLKVLQTFQGTASDKTGKVEFAATYLQAGQRAVHHEKSRFKRHAGRWYYLDGLVTDA